MEITYVNQDGTIFGSTRYLGIGRRQPKLIYGDKARALREQNNISLDDLAKEFKIGKELISDMENMKKGMSEKIMAKYMAKFDVPKEFFFDTDLDIYICSDDGKILKTYENSEECKKAFDFLKQEFLDGCKDGVKNFSMHIDFSKEA